MPRTAGPAVGSARRAYGSQPVFLTPVPELRAYSPWGISPNGFQSGFLNLLKRHGHPLEAGMHRPFFEVNLLMFRFDQLIRRDMIIRDVKQRYPQTAPLFETLRFHAVCDDCDIGTVVHKNGLNLPDVLDALNQAAFGSQAGTEEHGSNSIS